MALFDAGFTRCALCGEILAEGEDMVGTTHFLGDREHPLYRYSDALMHRACFLKWEHRAAFVAAYNAEMGDQSYMRGDGTIRDPTLFRIGGAVIDKIAAIEAWLRARRR